MVAMKEPPEFYLELAWVEFAESEETVPKSLALRAIGLAYNAGCTDEHAKQETHGSTGTS